MFSTALLEFTVSGLVFRASGLGFRFRVCVAAKKCNNIGSRDSRLGLQGMFRNRKRLGAFSKKKLLLQVFRTFFGFSGDIFGPMVSGFRPGLATLQDLEGHINTKQAPILVVRSFCGSVLRNGSFFAEQP